MTSTTKLQRRLDGRSRTSISKIALAVFSAIVALVLGTTPALAATSGTADHIDIAVDATATLVVGDEKMTSSVELEMSDFRGSNVSLTATQGGSAFTNFTMNNTGQLSTSDGASGATQIRVPGSYPTGTKSNPVTYTLTLTKPVTFKSTTGATYTVDTTFISSFNYWTTGNDCPQIARDKMSWQNGNFIQGSGFDFDLTGSSTKATLAITKVVSAEASAKGQTFTFGVYNSAGTKVDTVTITMGDSTAASKMILVDAGTSYYVVEESYPSTIGEQDYESTAWSISGPSTEKSGTGRETDAASAVAGSTTTYQFTNTYKTTTVDYDTAKAGFSKVFRGRDWAEGDVFSFAIKALDGAPEPRSSVAEVSGSDGSFDFGTITFTKEGTYVYEVTETAGTIGGIQYDEHVATLTITVAKVDGKLTVTESTVTDGAKFTNYYVPEDATLDTSDLFAKILTGRSWLESDSFTFTLVTTDDGPMPDGSAAEVTSADLEENGVAFFGFGTITFSEPGTYVYEVTEDEGTIAGITYDEHVATLTVTIADDGEGSLYVAECEVSDGTFTNKYAAAPAEVNLTINGLKVLQGADLADYTFTFQLLDSEGNVVATATNDAEGNVIFTGLKFDEAGTYDFTVVEVDDGQENITYGKSTYAVTITVTDDLAGSLVAEASYEGDCITNIYTEPVVEEPEKPAAVTPAPATPAATPTTGDTTNAVAWMIVALLAVIFVATGIMLRRRFDL